MRNKSILWMIISVIAVALLVFATNARAQADVPENTQQEPRTLSVNGNGTITLEPDIASINIGVQTEGANAQEAVNSNNEQSQQLFRALSGVGIADEDIKTSNFSIYPRQERDNEGQPTGITYVVNNTVSVTVRDLDQIGSILDSAVQVGANTINGIQFDVEDREAAQQQAMVAAVENARARAEVLATAADVSLGDVLSIQTYLGSATPIPYEKTFAMADTAASSVPVSPGEMQIMVDVSVVYEIQ